MADYKRIVSYIYQYNQQVKGNNVGFTRIETRSGQCKIIVHVRVPNLQDVMMNVYAYCWYDGMIHGVSLGSMSISGGIGEFKILTEADNLCHSQYRLADMGGILVYESDAVFLGTEWDDHPIQFEHLQVDTEKPDNFDERRIRRGESLPPSPKSVGSDSNESESDTKKPVIEDSVEEQVSLRAAENEPAEGEVASVEQVLASEELEEAENTLQQSELMEAAIEDASDMTATEANLDTALEEEKQSLSKQRMEQLDKRAEELFGSILNNTAFAPQEEEEDLDNTVVIDPKAAISFFTTFKSCESEQEYEEVQQEIEHLYARVGQLERVCREWKIKQARIKEHQQARWEAEQEKLSQEEEMRKNFDLQAADGVNGQMSEEESQDSFMDDDEENEIPPVVQRILSRYPAIEPFTDLEGGDCVRIEPQDIGIFPMENWILANNSFLLHGYYSYRHLIFFYKKVYNKIVYMLGVPGVNHSRERFMANMFGFAMFHPLTKVAGKDGVQAASNSMTNNPAFDEVAGGEFGYWCMEIRF